MTMSSPIQEQPQIVTLRPIVNGLPFLSLTLWERSAAIMVKPGFIHECSLNLTSENGVYMIIQLPSMFAKFETLIRNP